MACVYSYGGKDYTRDDFEKVLRGMKPHEIAEFAGVGSVPDMPMKENWHQMAFRRALREAAEGGYDKMTWTSGDQQNERWSNALRQRVDRITWGDSPVHDGRRLVHVEGPHGKISFDVDSDGKIIDSPHPMVREKSLASVVGADTAAKIMADASGHLSKGDLGIGMNGMRAFYDKMIPDYAKSLAKKYGSEVGKTRIDTGSKGYVTGDETIEPGAEVHSIDITPSLREAVMKGQPLFSAPRGPEKRDLVAVHNLSAGDLKRIDEMGGMPAPSIAITKDGIPFSGFGDITLIGNQEMIDPERRSQNRIFSNDAYTATPPQKEWDTNKAAASRLWDRLKNYRDTGDYFGDLDSKVAKGPESLAYELRKSNAMRIAFLHDHGIEFTIPTRKQRMSAPFSDEQALKDFFRANPKGDLYENPAFHEAWKQARNQHIEKLSRGDVSTDDLKSIRDSIDSTWTNDEGKVALGYAHRYEGDRTKILTRAREIDQQKADIRLARLVKKVGQDKFDDMIQKTVGDIYMNPHLKIGRTKAPYNLDNIMEFMDRQDMRGAQEAIFHGLGLARAKGAKRFDSIDQVRRNSDRIIGEDAGKEQWKGLETEFHSLADRLRPYYAYQDANPFNKLDDASRALAEAGKRRGSPEMALRKFDYRDVPAGLAENFADFADRFHNAPVGYFEAKPMRQVGLGEFKGAVVPRGTSQDTLDLLRKHGVTNIRYYAKGDEAARSAQVSKFKTHMFAPGLTYTPEFQQHRTAMADDVTKIVNRITDGKAQIVFNDVMIGGGKRLAESGGGSTPRPVGGRFSPLDSLIEVSLMPQFDGRKNAAHESWHWIKQNGIFKDNEIKALDSNRHKLGEMVKAEGYDHTTMSNEEIEAVAFARYWKQRAAGQEASGVPPVLRAAFERIIEFFRALKDRLQQQGFKGLSDVFQIDQDTVMRRASQGTMARRLGNQPPAERRRDGGRIESMH